MNLHRCSACHWKIEEKASLNHSCSSVLRNHWIDDGSISCLPSPLVSWKGDLPLLFLYHVDSSEVSFYCYSRVFIEILVACWLQAKQQATERQCLYSLLGRTILVLVSYGTVHLLRQNKFSPKQQQERNRATAQSRRRRRRQRGKYFETQPVRWSVVFRPTTAG